MREHPGYLCNNRLVRYLKFVKTHVFLHVQNYGIIKLYTLRRHMAEWRHISAHFYLTRTRWGCLMMSKAHFFFKKSLGRKAVCRKGSIVFAEKRRRLQVQTLVFNLKEIRKKGKGCTWKVKWKERRYCVGLWRPRLLSEEKNGRSLGPEQPIRDQSELILQVKKRTKNGHHHGSWYSHSKCQITTNHKMIKVSNQFYKI